MGCSSMLKNRIVQGSSYLTPIVCFTRKGAERIGIRICIGLQRSKSPHSLTRPQSGSDDGVGDLKHALEYHGAGANLLGDLLPYIGDQKRKSATSLPPSRNICSTVIDVIPMSESGQSCKIIGKWKSVEQINGFHEIREFIEASPRHFRARASPSVSIMVRH